MKVFIVAAITADGFIARNTTHVADWTSTEDKKNFAALTKAAGVMVMGARTFDTIGRVLPGRRNIVYTRHPQDYAQEGIETTDESPQELVKRLESEGHESLAVIGGAQVWDIFVKSGLVNELYLTIEPKLFGAGISLLQSSVDLNLSLIDTRQIAQDSILLHYGIK